MQGIITSTAEGITGMNTPGGTQIFSRHAQLGRQGDGGVVTYKEDLQEQPCACQIDALAELLPPRLLL